ncbi:MAG: Hsp70 family protein, partial [Planctomycetes bacterium]|nr:Hsp70 family protein [Planctomycetota bacterium]
ADDDKARRELIDLKNQADQVVYSTKKSLEEHGEKLTSEVRGNIESAISNLEDKIKGDDKDAIEAALKQFNEVSIELGKAVYEATAASAGTAGTAAQTDAGDESESKPADDIIDAEYEVKDDK